MRTSKESFVYAFDPDSNSGIFKIWADVDLRWSSIEFGNIKAGLIELSLQEGESELDAAVRYAISFSTALYPVSQLSPDHCIYYLLQTGIKVVHGTYDEAREIKSSGS